MGNFTLEHVDPSTLLIDGGNVRSDLHLEESFTLLDEKRQGGEHR